MNERALSPEMQEALDKIQGATNDVVHENVELLHGACTSVNITMASELPLSSYVHALTEEIKDLRERLSVLDIVCGAEHVSAVPVEEISATTPSAAGVSFVDNLGGVSAAEGGEDDASE